MEFRFSPCNALLFFVVLGILFFLNSFIAIGQCNDEFSYETFSADKETASGRIEITKVNPESGVYAFKVFKVDAKITLLKTGEVASPGEIVIEGLSPGHYLVKIEWGTNCYRTVGGLEGILITRKEQ